MFLTLSVPCVQAGYNLDRNVEAIQFHKRPDMPQFRKGLEELRTATKLVSDAYTSGTG